MIKVSLVSYLNSIPFKWGIENYPDKLNLDLSLDYPAACAQKVIEGQVDLGLIPVAVIPLIKNAQIVSPYGIGAKGKVDSVLLVSNSPIEEIKSVTLDYQSRSSIALTKVLFKEFWKQNVNYVNAKEDYLNSILSSEAKVVIGDRALNIASNYKYVWDLPDIWYQFTGLPFVFAAWVANKPINIEWLANFNKALEFGLKNIDEFLPQIAGDYPTINVEDYLTQKIKYQISGNEYQNSIQKFLGFLKNLDGC